ncbi:MAG: long-chain fatty acid--CoA ligase [Bacteroidales bacterium]|nr:long-chain fatty acid--CoA ligase [Bacteroidales bacterium]
MSILIFILFLPLNYKSEGMEVTRTFDLLSRYKELYPDKPDALAGKEKGIYAAYSANEYIENATLLSYGFMALGLTFGDKVAIISNNRPEWNFVDMGLAQAGMINIPIYPTISEEEYKYILNHAEPKLVIVSDKMLFQKLSKLTKEISSIQGIYSFNNIGEANNWNTILQLGRDNAKIYEERLNDLKKSITPDDIVTLIYTSGTTGFPKGVLLSHNNLVSNFKTTSKAHELNYNHRTLSFLPLCHIYERMMNYHYQYKGMSIYYAENMGTIANDIKEVKPDMFVTVPRLLERVYDKFIAAGKDLKGFKKTIYFWAVNLGLRYELHGENGWLYELKRKIADKLVYSKWRESLGGNLKLVVSGGAALQPRLARIFSAGKVLVIEGYGLTETSPVIAVNNPHKNEVMFGSVGPILEGVEVKIANDGEILCKGSNVMQGYYKAQELTKEVIDEEGWFHTGDVGELVDNYYLKITDRKKEIFKLSSGKYIAPQVIENRFKESIFIEQLMVIGENQKFASALISPNFYYLHNWCAEQHIRFRDNKELIKIPAVLECYQNEVNEMNKGLALHEQIKRFRLVPEEWSPQAGELSQTLKLKRKLVFEEYKGIIDEIYSVDKINGID